MAFSGMEWIVAVVAIVLFLFGAKKIPEFAKGMGRAAGEFRRGRMMVEREILDMEKDIRSEPRDRAEGDDHARTEVSPSPSPIRDAARELGIDTEGRSEAELKQLIRARVTEEAS